MKISLLPMGRAWPLLLLPALFFAESARSEKSTTSGMVAPAWREWSPAVFAEAKREHKFVLLDLQAVWCHWCHVMEAETYADPAVNALLADRYIAVRVDQDSRPDLANRYEDYGWPATVVFAADGSEIVKRRGFIPPTEMRSLLQAIIDDPTPGPSVQPEACLTAVADAAVPDQKRDDWARRIVEGYDRERGGWGDAHKFLDWDNEEYAMTRAQAGDVSCAAIAREMLTLQRKLIDPVWGGVYQYSAEGDWDHPHFEKIMPMQTENIRIYAQAFQRRGDPADLRTARAIYGYVRSFLTHPDGVVYTSQDADLNPGEQASAYFALDDTARRRRGMPRVDTHVYARENGAMIVALADLYAATGEPKFLAEARAAAEWIGAHRALVGGGFRHDETDRGGPFLGDTLGMGRAFLALYTATGERIWLERAEAAASFIRIHFSTTSAGWATADTTHGELPAPRPQFDENVALARFTNLLARHTGNPADREIAEQALRWLAAPEVVGARGPFLGGLWLAEAEFASEPLHIAVVGAKGDPVARRLFEAATRVPENYKLIEWWDRAEGAAPRGEAIYPELGRAAAFVCDRGACSAPIVDVTALETRLAKRLTAAKNLR